MRLTAQRRTLLREALAFAAQAYQCDARDAQTLAAKLGLSQELARVVQAKVKHANEMARKVEKLMGEIEG